MKSCLGCSKDLNPRIKGERCQKCRKAHYQSLRGNCSSCGKLLGRDNKVGKCRVCNVQQGRALALQDPARAAQMRQAWSTAARRNFWSPETRERWRKTRPAANQKISQRRMGWCPAEYRAEYFRLARCGNKNAETARRLIEERIAKDRIGSLTATGLSSAIDYLRRYTAIFLREDGYQYGTAILTAEQLVERALQKGWQPSEWAA